MNYIYTEQVYNKYAPSRVLPIILDNFSVSSVLDVGCGIGTWLHIARSLGITDILGIDNESVNSSLLSKYIDKKDFLSLDLSKEFDLQKKFDLVLCLEVAEHIPEESSDVLIKSLVLHGDLILFSAAIPGQGGQNHINENWPSYWIEKFLIHGFYCYDIVRPKIWNDKDMDFWYKQNIFLFSNRDIKVENFSLGPVIHPELFISKLSIIQNLKSELNQYKSVRFVFSKLLELIKNRLFW